MTIGASAGRTAWIDARAGIAGDMCLGALVDAGLPLAFLQDIADRLDLGPLTVAAEPTRRGALAATRVTVCIAGVAVDGARDVHRPSADDPHDHAPHRSLAEVLGHLARLGDLDASPLSQAAAVFTALADAEAAVHGETRDTIHFHEVGAADALVDVAGTCLGLHALGVERVHVSSLPWSQGTVLTAHGHLPLPAPATWRLLEGWPTHASEAGFEQVTPTGAALVKVLASGDRPPDGFVVARSGMGAGAADRGPLPNVVRLAVGASDGTPSSTSERVVELATNLDDASPQVVAHTVATLLAQGALDAWWHAVTMKKGRPGVVLRALVRPEDADRLETVILSETPTLGVRQRAWQRRPLERRWTTVETPWGDVRMKVRDAPDGARATPEFEDCRARAEAAQVPVQDVQAAAMRAWALSQPTPGE